MGGGAACADSVGIAEDFDKKKAPGPKYAGRPALCLQSNRLRELRADAPLK
jgi:hypothetical protein